VTTHSSGGTTGLRGVINIPVMSRTWADAVCSPAVTPGCCVTSTYGDDTVANGEMLVNELDFILSPTTDSATGAFVDLNADGCKRAGAGFPSPLSDGPWTLVGSPAPGPCCTAGQAVTVVAVAPGFSGGPPLNDLGFLFTMPSTVASCTTASAGGSCVLTTDPCLGSPSGAFLDWSE